jgi:hypothetical protein
MNEYENRRATDRKNDAERDRMNYKRAGDYYHRGKLFRRAAKRGSSIGMSPIWMRSPRAKDELGVDQCPREAGS